MWYITAAHIRCPLKGIFKSMLRVPMLSKSSEFSTLRFKKSIHVFVGRLVQGGTEYLYWGDWGQNKYTAYMSWFNTHRKNTLLEYRSRLVSGSLWVSMYLAGGKANSYFSQQSFKGGSSASRSNFLPPLPSWYCTILDRRKEVPLTYTRHKKGTSLTYLRCRFRAELLRIGHWRRE